MNCPKCGAYLNREFPPLITIENFQEHQDIVFKCENSHVTHVYFVRIYPSDLIETQ